MRFKKLRSWAKINLSLNVIKRLPNNYHNIESLITFVQSFDEIKIKIIDKAKHKISFSGKFSKGIGKNNTIIELLNLLEKNKLIKNKKFEIKVTKNIPQKSGMGGGSMNAASLINYFIKKRIFKLDKKELINLANLVGSDVILGVNLKNTVLSSNGKLTKFKKKLGYYVLVVKPSFGCATNLIYSKVKYFSKPKYNSPKQSLFNTKNIVNSKNDLEQIVFKIYPKLKKLKLFLIKLPNIIFARMSGSGSSIVAYFHSKKATDIAAKKFKRKFNNYWYTKSKTI